MIGTIKCTMNEPGVCIQLRDECLTLFHEGDDEFFYTSHIWILHEHMREVKCLDCR